MTEQTRNNIVEKAWELFYLVGIRSVSIDDICRALGMSKKTFYVYFATKDDLVSAILDTNINKVRAHMHEHLSGRDFASLLKGYHEFVRLSKQKDDIREVPSLVFDLKKYYPSQFQKFQERILDLHREQSEQLIRLGIREGYVREDIDVEMAALLIAKVHNDTVRDLEMMQQRSVSVTQLSRTALDMLVRGLLNERGFRLLNDMNNNETNN